jgi:flagellin-like hook-associated protein FlgL
LNAIKVIRPVNREEKNITKISFVSDGFLNLVVPKSFCSDTSSLGQAIQKIRGGPPLLKAIAKAIRVQSGVLARMRDLAIQSASETTNKIEQKAISSHFLGLQKELSGSQDFLIKSVKTLNVTMENLSAADSTIREKDFTKKVAMLTKNQFFSTAPIVKKE